MIAILAGVATVSASCSRMRHDHAAGQPAERFFSTLSKDAAEEVVYRRLNHLGYGDYTIMNMSLSDGVWHILAVPDVPDIPIGSQKLIEVYPNGDCQVRGGH